MSNSHQISSMKGLSCYRVGADAGAGFKEGDLDILGTEGILHCIGILIATEDAAGATCYYLGHMLGDRTTPLKVKEELERILTDVQKLTDRKLSWSSLSSQITLVGLGSSTDEPSSCYKQTFKILTQEGAKPTPLFGSSIAFNLTGKGDLIVLDPEGQLIEGTESARPRVGHGVYSPVDNERNLESNKPFQKLISDNKEESYTDRFVTSKL